ncbi:M48 family metallopeptidase [Pseudomonas sp. CGJS7]|uniref:M48 family metallopeptidase n=1 Tax=Pseudomonas sp. CGJS7 TaxID=3109348 RepID=UPI00300B0B75
MPAQLTAPSAAYRRHAWLAMAGLLAFVAIYFALLGWFGWTAFRLFASIVRGNSDNVLLAAGASACAAFLCVFMAKALIFNKRGSKDAHDMELKPAEQPELFAFLHRLADEAGAPRPHRVFLSPRVNAGVFYDLSLANLIVPSKKNLEIGLALVNALNLGEFKAVLAHEFGHFAQRTMAVGRWVYIAQQIAAHIIAKRDAFDDFLSGLSRFDLRVAWIGWLLSLVVWSIRSLVEIVFRVVILAQRALSREMEYQADLVAASLTGSDALVHALHRLGAADDAWDRTLSFANREYATSGRYWICSRSRRGSSRTCARCSPTPNTASRRSCPRTIATATASSATNWPSRRRCGRPIRPTATANPTSSASISLARSIRVRPFRCCATPTR